MIRQIRVDDRLVHGQVAVVWSKQFNTKHMVVANDEAAKNETQQMTLKMATPSGINLLVRPVDESIKIFNSDKVKKIKMFVLTDTVADALKIAKNCEVQSINVANVGRFDTSIDKRKINSDLSLNKDEYEALKEMSNLSIEVIHQVIPSKPKLSIKELLDK